MAFPHLPLPGLWQQPRSYQWWKIHPELSSQQYCEHFPLCNNSPTKAPWTITTPLNILGERNMMERNNLEWWTSLPCVGRPNRLILISIMWTMISLIPKPLDLLCTERSKFQSNMFPPRYLPIKIHVTIFWPLASTSNFSRKYHRNILVWNFPNQYKSKQRSW